MHGSVFVPAKLTTRMSELGLTPHRLAEKAGLTRRGVERIIRGDRNPRDITLAQLADALGCTIADLCEPRQVFHPAALTARRAALRMTSRALATKAGVSYDVLLDIQRGHQPDDSDLAKLADALDCTVDDLTTPSREEAAA